MIISSRYEVFKTVGFRIPLDTPLTCTEMLLAVTNCKDNFDHEVALQLLDIAFVQVWLEHFRYNYFSKKKMKMHVNSILYTEYLTRKSVRIQVMLIELKSKFQFFTIEYKTIRRIVSYVLIRSYCLNNSLITIIAKFAK